MIFSPMKQEMTNCSRKNRDQMMLGGLKYDKFTSLRDSVFCLL